MNRRFYITFNCELGSFLSFAVISCLFLFGSVFGALLGRGLNNVSYAFDFLNTAFLEKSSTDFSLFLGAFFDNAFWAVIMLLCAFSAFGILGAAACSVLKGVLASFFVCIFVRIYGADGILISLFLFSVELLFVVPFFLVLLSKTAEASLFVSKLSFAHIGGSESNCFRSFICVFAIYLVVSAVLAILKCFVLYPAALSLVV